MKRSKLCLSVLLAFAGASASALAQSTAFTYQGELKENGAPVAGAYDLQFRLFDSLAGGVQVGTTQCVNNVNVQEGRFTVTLDFGQQFALPASRFMQVDVRLDSGLACTTATGYTSLTPRQLLTATPLANHAKAAFSLDAADGAPTNSVFVDNAGKVGIGTLTPTHSVHVAAVGPTIALQDTAAASQQAGYISYRDNANVERAWVGYGTPGSPLFSMINARASGKIELRTLGGGGSVYLPSDNLGVGTTTPTAPVHIASDLNAVILLQDTGPNSTQSGYVDFRNSSGVETAWVGFGTPGDPDFSIINARAGGDIVLNPLGGGVVRVNVLEITGADLAEKFPASEKLEPGMVAAIDAKNPGKLCVAQGEYNRCVAGVVSGANNFSVGAVLGNLPGHGEAPAIALSGRVYVWCDASTGAIQPGDMLTSSSTPGHAMKASDRDRSHGAVIGKAMEPLSSGKGLVLVLVNLQ